MPRLEPGKSDSGSGARRARPSAPPRTTTPESHPANARRWNRRTWAGAAAVVALAWLGWEIVATTAASSHSAMRPELALAWRPSAPGALVQSAEQGLAIADSKEEIARAEAEAARALAINPLESDALRVLGLAAEKSGDPERAAILMRSAAARSPRDVRSQAWLFARAAADSDFEEAMVRLDAMLRARPEVGAPLLAVLVEVAGIKSAQPVIAERLGTNPPWRPWFLTAIAQEIPDSRDLTGLYTALKSTSVPATDAELMVFLSRMVGQGHYELAYLNWITLLPASRLVSIGRLTNGGFEEPVSGVPFDWRIDRVRGVETEVSKTGSDGNRALRLKFYGIAVPYGHVSQMLLLPAGRYRFSGQVRSFSLKNERGMQWTIACADDGEVLGATERISGSAPWSAFEATFEVPGPAVCRAQYLRLELAARIKAEQQISGEIWYDGLAIARLDDDKSAAPAEKLAPIGVRQ